MNLMNHIFSKLGFSTKLTRPETIALMKDYDTNKDSRLSKQEFIKVFKQFRSQFDPVDK